MTNLVVGIGEVIVSRDAEAVIKTYALGSCVGLIFWAPELKAAGMAHIALPDSKLGSESKNQLPAYFADKAIPLLVENFKRFGVLKNSQVIIKMAGGANILDPQAKFNIGKRNVLAIKKLLWKYRLGALAEDIGQSFSRTVSVNVKDGQVNVSSPKKGTWQL